MDGVNMHLLLEANIRNLKDKTANTDPTRVEKSHNVQSRYLGISKFGILNFQTTSETHDGAKWYQTIEIPNIMQLADILDDPTDHITAGDVQALLSSNDIKVMCDDPSWLYWSWKYMAWSNDYGREPETRAPKRNNTRLRGALCKHLYSVMDLIQDQKTLTQIASDIENWIKYSQGDKYSNFNRPALMGQANKKKDKIDWENYDSYLNDYFASLAGKNKFLDDEDIKNSLKAEIERAGKTDPNLTLDDFLKDELGFTRDELAQELQIAPQYVDKYFKDLGF